MIFSSGSDKAKAAARRRAKKAQQQKKKLAKQQQKRLLLQQKKVKQAQKQRVKTAAQMKKNSSQPSFANQEVVKTRRRKFQLGVMEISAIAFVILALPVIIFIISFL